MLLKQTKIVASISDRRCDVDFIRTIDAGMNVVRMNTAHASREIIEADRNFIPAKPLMTRGQCDHASRR